MYKILSVGGSIIIPKTGFDIKFLKNFRALILKRVKQGEKFIFVIGGGATCRNYQAAANSVRKLSAEELDWLGIYTTWYNAEFVRLLFGDLAYELVVKNPTKKINTKKPIIIAGGWKPGNSTDYDAVKLAEVYKATEVANLSNVDFVCDQDPNKYPNARRLETVSWADFRKIVGDKWVPGANVPFDPKAAKLAQKLGLKVVFARGTDLAEVSKILNGKKAKGTIIK